MTQQVIITTESPRALKPFLEAAIQNEKRLILHGIERTRQRLAEFEQQFGLELGEFKSRYEAGELDETLDFIDWLMEIKALGLLEEQYQALDDARVD